MAVAICPPSNLKGVRSIVQPRYVTPAAEYRCSGSIERPDLKRLHPCAKLRSGPESLNSSTYMTRHRPRE
eukprot:11205699-Lingulodinium_polyedra.AAC.1